MIRTQKYELLFLCKCFCQQPQTIAINSNGSNIGPIVNQDFD